MAYNMFVSDFSIPVAAGTGPQVVGTVPAGETWIMQKIEVRNKIPTAPGLPPYATYVVARHSRAGAVVEDFAVSPAAGVNGCLAVPFTSNIILDRADLTHVGFGVAKAGDTFEAEAGDAGAVLTVTYLKETL